MRVSMSKEAVEEFLNRVKSLGRDDLQDLIVGIEGFWGGVERDSDFKNEWRTLLCEILENPEIKVVEMDLD